jgi:hypothetical protein
LNYIHTTVDKEEMVSVFGSQFGKKVEWFKDKFGAGDAIDNKKCDGNKMLWWFC